MHHMTNSQAMFNLYMSIKYVVNGKPLSLALPRERRMCVCVCTFFHFEHTHLKHSILWHGFKISFRMQLKLGLCDCLFLSPEYI